MLTELKVFVKTHSRDILIFLAIILISLFSFAAGYLTSEHGQKEQFRIETMP